MQRSERRKLFELAYYHIPENGLAIEVGTWKGGSAAIIGEICRQRNGRLICIDLFNHDLHGKNEENGPNPDFMASVMKNLEGLPITFMNGTSEDILHYLADDIADLIFIDGVHSMPGVKVDIEGYWSKLKTGGLYCGHDYGNGPCYVDKVVDEFLGPAVNLVKSLWFKTK